MCFLKKFKDNQALNESTQLMESIIDEDETNDQALVAAPLTFKANPSKLNRLPSEKRVEFSIGSSKLLSSKNIAQFRPKSALKRFNIENTKYKWQQV